MANMKKLLCGTFACIMVVAGALGMASCGKKNKSCAHEWSDTTKQATCVDNGEKGGYENDWRL